MNHERQTTPTRKSFFQIWRRIVLILLALTLLLAPATAGAQPGDWPSRPLHLIVSWPPGGSADTTARLVGERLAKRLGQPVVVENRPGAGGKIGTLVVTRSEPDGYTLLLGAPSEITIAPATTRAMQYDPLKDLKPVSTLVSGAFMLVAGPNLPVQNVADLVAYAKANPVQTSYASYGNNTTNHLYGEQFNAAAGISAVHVAYRGGAPAWTDLMGGRVQYMFENAALAMPMVRGGKLKGLAVLAPQRIALAADVPTISEAGYPGIGMRSWLGLFVPAKTPAPIVKRLNEELVAILALPDMVKQLEERGAPASSSTVEEFERLVKSETEAWRELVARLGLKLD